MGNVNIRDEKGRFIKGHVPSFSQSHRAKISFSKIGEKNSMFGTKHSKEWKKEASNRVKGENHWNWKGGISSIESRIKSSSEYKEWRLNILKRDYYKCIWCSSKKKLEVDHIFKFSVIVHLLRIKFGIDNLYEKVINNALFRSTKNGRTLCRECHKVRTLKGYAINNIGAFHLLLGRRV